MTTTRSHAARDRRRLQTLIRRRDFLADAVADARRRRNYTPATEFARRELDALNWAIAQLKTDRTEVAP